VPLDGNSVAFRFYRALGRLKYDKGRKNSLQYLSDDK
jgi:hypothetical protein